MLLNELLLWVPVVTLLACVPFVCYKDYKYREVKHNFWLPIIFANATVWLYFVMYGIYEGWMLGVSAVAICVYFAMMKTHLIEGADFVFMSLIALFLVISPITGVPGLAAMFTIFLIACTVSSAMIVKTLNAASGKIAIRSEMFPMMFPISAALIFTVVLV
jgi:hypothetical protein